MVSLEDLCQTGCKQGPITDSCLALELLFVVLKSSPLRPQLVVFSASVLASVLGSISLCIKGLQALGCLGRLRLERLDGCLLLRSFLPKSSQYLSASA